MSIMDKLMPPPPVTETGAPSPPLTPEAAKLIQSLLTALKDHGIIITPEQLTIKPPTPPPPPSPKAPLTRQEETLLGRSQGFIVDALKQYGLSLSSNESVWIGALVADFVQIETGVPKASLAEAAVGATSAPASTVRKIG